MDLTKEKTNVIKADITTIEVDLVSTQLTNP